MTNYTLYKLSPIQTFLCNVSFLILEIGKYVFSENRNCLRHFPQKLSEPHLLWNNVPRRKPSSGEIFPLRGIWSRFVHYIFSIYCSWFFPVYKLSRIEALNSFKLYEIEALTE